MTVRLSGKLYSKMSLLKGIFGNTSKTANKLTLPSAFTPEEIVNVPLRCFTRTKDGEIVLYRGLANRNKDFVTNYAGSVADEMGLTMGELENKSALELVRDFSGLTQRGDPILHTTTKRHIAKGFADNGVLIEYHIPQEYLARRGIVGHIGENEINFVHSINSEYVAKVTQTKPKNYFGDTGLPEFIDITI